MRPDRVLLLGIIAVVAALSAYIVLPYVQFLIAAVLLAFVLRPVHLRLSAYINETASAVLMVVLSVVAVILPAVAIIFVIAEDAIAWARQLQEADVDFTPAEELIATYTGREVNLEEQIASAVEDAIDITFGSALAVFEAFTHALIGTGLLLFLLFFFVRDGPRLIEWMRAVSPFPRELTDEIDDRTRNIVKAVLVGHVLIAVIQGGVAGIGLFVTGVPNVIFWTFVMILLALIPLIGTFLVWAPASLYLYAMGNVIAGVGLFVYGVLVVSISDEYLRPIVVDRFAQISPSVIIIGVVGGISAFGFIGLFVGPMIVGALKEYLEIYHEQYADG